MIKLNYLQKHIEMNFTCAKQFAEVVGLSESFVSLLLHSKRDVGLKSISLFRNYCKANNLELSDFIEL